jgi:NAD(P)-dependent dehydrogenase (short-subunit alcohol dehydrogenase family)
VTDDASVSKAVEQVVRSTGRLDLVVNNAGGGLLGGAEDSSIAQASRLFDVNLFGVARVMNAALPVMRRQKRGRIINVSSILGLIPQPFSAYYSSTKHALEGYSESLDHEARNFGVRVLLVEPGVTRTAFEDNITRPDQPIATYEADRSRVERLIRNLITGGDAPQVVAKTILEAATAEKPKLRYPAGKQARQLRSLRRLLPESVFDKVVRRANELPAKAVS